MDCIFCKIVAGNLPSSLVDESQDCLAFLDLYPASKGHTLIIPKVHYDHVLDMPAAVAGSMMVLGQKVAKAVMQATAADGFNFHMATHAAAGQTVFHTHLHIIPRMKTQHEDKILGWTSLSYAEGEMEILHSSILQLTGYTS